MIIQSNLN